MQLHQRGVDLLVNVLDAADHVERLTPGETQRLLMEVAQVMCLILERDARIALKAHRRYRAKLKSASRENQVGGG